MGLLVFHALGASGATLSGFTPDRGPAGTVVTISGSSLQTVSAVFFGAMEASAEIISRTAGTLQARVPANALTGPVSVFSPQGSASTTQIFVAAPRIEDIEPAVGGVGTLVTISGANFGTGFGRGQITRVDFNGVPAAFQVSGLGQLVTVVPNGASSGPITVVNEAGTFSTLLPFHVTALLTGFSPSRGMPGDSITIQGSNLGSVLGISFGAAAANFAIVSPTNVLAFVPTNAVNAFIQVTTPAGVAVTSSNFVVTPRIIRFTPLFGQVGTNVVLEGGGLHGVTEVQFNGVKATSLTPVSSTRVQVTVPNGAATGPIKIITTNGTYTTEENFQFPARLSTFTPSSGARGDVITVDGQNLGGVQRVLFNGVEATFTLVSGTRLTAVVPALATTGRVTLENAAGSETSSSTFTVRPVLDGFSPGSGPVGTAIHLQGAGLTNVTWVRIGDLDAASVTVINSTNVRAIVPLGAYSGPVRIRTSAGVEAEAPGNFFVQGAVPTITSFDPTSGTAGTAVVLKGTGLRTTSQVAFGGTQATFTVVSATEAHTTVPAGATTGVIAVTTLDGIAVSTAPFEVGGGGGAPALMIVRDSGSVILRWPASATGYALEGTQDLGPEASWLAVNAATFPDGANVRVTLPVDSVARYFRLRKP